MRTAFWHIPHRLPSIPVVLDRSRRRGPMRHDDRIDGAGGGTNGPPGIDVAPRMRRPPSLVDQMLSQSPQKRPPSGNQSFIRRRRAPAPSRVDVRQQCGLTRIGEQDSTLRSWRRGATQRPRARQDAAEQCFRSARHESARARCNLHHGCENEDVGHSLSSNSREFSSRRTTPAGTTRALWPTIFRTAHRSDTVGSHLRPVRQRFQCCLVLRPDLRAFQNLLMS